MDTISRGKTFRSSYIFLPRARARRHEQPVANHRRLPFLTSIIGRKLRHFTRFRSREGRWKEEKKRDGNIETVDNRENEGLKRGGEGRRGEIEGKGKRGGGGGGVIRSERE